MSLPAGPSLYTFVLLHNSLNKKDQHKSSLQKNACCKPKGGWNITNLTLLHHTDLYSSTCTQGHWEPLSLVSLQSSNRFYRWKGHLESHCTALFRQPSSACFLSQREISESSASLLPPFCLPSLIKRIRRISREQQFNRGVLHRQSFTIYFFHLLWYFCHVKKHLKIFPA